MDEAGRGSAGLAVGLGRRKDKHIYPGTQAKEKDNVNHGSCQRGTRHEETTGRTHNYADAKKERQAQMEPLQERATEVIAWAEEDKTCMA
jgi:hypothetical protein